MRILFLLTTNAFAGAENVTLQIADHMQKRGHTVAYCSPHGVIEDWAHNAGIPFIGLHKFSLREIKCAAANFGPDVIYAVDYRASFYASLISRCTIGHLHCDCAWLKRICAQSIVLYITALRAVKLICVSPNIYQNYVFGNHWISSKFITLTNAFSELEVLQKSKEFSCEKRYDVGFCGRLTEQKDPFAFLQVIAALKKERPAIRAVMIGGGELEDQVRNQIEKLDLKKEVDLLGFQTNPFPYIVACRVLVMTSRWEGFPMAALEAMALQKPVIATPVSGLRDIITDGCGGIRSTMPQIASRVQECLQMPEDQFQKLQRMAYGKAKLHGDIEAYIDQIEEQLQAASE